MKNLVLLVVGVFVAFAPVPGTAHPAEHESLNHVWVLQTLQGKPVTERGMEVATLRFNLDRTVTGTWACNSLGPGKLKWASIQGAKHGTIATDGAGAGVITVVGCGNTRAVAISHRFWRLMETAREWSIDDRRGLSVRFADGSSARLVSAESKGR